MQTPCGERAARTGIRNRIVTLRFVHRLLDHGGEQHAGIGMTRRREQFDRVPLQIRP